MNNHKAWVSQVFDSSASQYGKKNCSFFNYFGKRLVEQVPILANQSALDIATGKGAILFPLAEVIGSLGKVVGIDISQQMLKETSLDAQKQLMDWIDLVHMDAEQLDFPDHSFDFVFCGFALFFFPSIAKALSEFKRVLKPGGTLAVSIWGKDSELDALVNKEISTLSNVNSLAVSPLWSSHSLQGVLEKAHFKNIQIIEENKEFSHDTPNEWWDSLWTHGTRAKLEQLSSQQLVDLHEKIITKAKHVDKGNGLAEELQVFYGIAQKN
jgi:ubiquinone/menaquinone biosynthesis C-methylase UbiE